MTELRDVTNSGTTLATPGRSGAAGRGGVRGRAEAAFEGARGSPEETAAAAGRVAAGAAGRTAAGGHTARAADGPATDPATHAAPPPPSESATAARAHADPRGDRHPGDAGAAVGEAAETAVPNAARRPPKSSPRTTRTPVTCRPGGTARACRRGSSAEEPETYDPPKVIPLPVAPPPRRRRR